MLVENASQICHFIVYSDLTYLRNEINLTTGLLIGENC